MNIFGFGLPEIIIVAIILLLFFGPKRLPSLFDSIGQSVKKLKDGMNGEPKDTGSSAATDEAPVSSDRADSVPQETQATPASSDGSKPNHS